MTSNPTQSIPAGRAQAGAADVETLLRRSDAHVVAADLASDPAERFVHGHLAAIRAGAALLAGSAPVRRRRGRPRPVWDLVAEVSPELSEAAAGFARGARVRAAFEAGRAPDVSHEAADRTVAAAVDFQDAVRRVLTARAEMDRAS